MKKLIAAALSILATCTAIGMIISRAEADQKPAECEHIYIFHEYNGFVACTEKGSEEPFLITDTRVSSLQPLDRLMLASGVEVSGAKAMSRVLEDYCS